MARKRDVVLRLMQGEPVEGLSRRLAVPVWQPEEWRRHGLAGIDAGLRERDDDPKDRQRGGAHRRIGELNMENELVRLVRLLPPYRSARGATSVGCSVWVTPATSENLADRPKAWHPMTRQERLVTVQGRRACQLGYNGRARTAP